MWTVLYRQNAGLLQLGLAGFVRDTAVGKSGRAGACAALTALKPHLLAVFGVLAVSLTWAGSLPGFFWVAPAVLVLCLAAGLPRPAARGS